MDIGVPSGRLIGGRCIAFTYFLFADDNKRPQYSFASSIESLMRIL